MSEKNLTWRWILAGLVLWVLCEVSAICVGYHFGRLESAKDLRGYESAIEECAEDLRKNCRGLLDYAGLLEDENGKLHMKIKNLEKRINAR